MIYYGLPFTCCQM